MKNIFTGLGTFFTFAGLLLMIGNAICGTGIEAFTVNAITFSAGLALLAISGTKKG